jgi:hypothetical protein
MAVTKSQTTTRRRPADRVAAWFLQWLTTQDEASVLDERASELRDRILSSIEKSGQEDEKGSLYLDLTTPVEFKDHEGNVKRFVTLKREKYVTPANPLPDPTKATELLKKLKLWISKSDQKLLQEIGLANPYIKIEVKVDVDALAQAYYSGKISEEEYDACLVEQKEGYRFKPLTK